MIPQIVLFEVVVLLLWLVDPSEAMYEYSDEYGMAQQLYGPAVAATGRAGSEGDNSGALHSFYGDYSRQRPGYMYDYDYKGDYLAPATHGSDGVDAYSMRSLHARTAGIHGSGHMNSFQKTYAMPQPEKVFVPVIIKKKNKKKKKIISSHAGFYIPGGTQMFGKFKDLHSCQKACEITPTCFAGDFNPWLGKCYLHGNLSACDNLRSHKAITHFKKVPCDILETTRGFVALGVSVINGIEIKGIDTLSDCIKKCATSGGGVATTDTNIVIEGQVCCHIDYDFASHKCWFHPCVAMSIAQAQFCYPVPTITDPPLNSVANPTTISITICPLSELK